MSADGAATEGPQQPALSGGIWLALAVILAAGLWLRVERLGEVPLFGDEHHSLALVDRPLGEILTRFDDSGTHIALPLAQRLAQQLIGPGVLALRLPALLAGIASLLLCFPIARGLVGATPALLTTLALALSPMHLYYSRFGRAYLPALLLGMVLLHAARRASSAVGRPRRGWMRWAAVALLAAALPWVHLSALPLVGAAALASLARSWSVRRRPADLVAPLLAFALGLALAALLYLPVADSLIAYLQGNRALSAPGPLSALDVTTLLAGGRLAGALWLGALPLALLWLAAARSRAAIWLLAAVVGPLLGLLLSTPHGMAYAYARYLLLSLPFVWMALAWLLLRLLERLAGGPGPRARALTGTLGTAALLALFISGPAGPLRADDHPFDNSYLALRALPAFDRADPQSPAFYAQLAAEPGTAPIIEAPLLASRARLLYRHDRLLHGRPVLIGVVGEARGALGHPPYVPLNDTAALRLSGAEYLVLHLAVDAELARYWRFVYEQALPEVRTPGDQGFMARQRAYTSQPLPRLHPLVAPLSESLGEPLYRDALIVVWRL